MPKKYYFYGILAVVVFIAVVCGVFGWYPVLIIGRTPIFAGTFRSMERATSASYEKIASFYASSSSAIAQPAPSDIAVATLTQLVEADLIRKKLEEEYDPETLQNLIQDKLAPYDSEANLAAAAQTIYGWSYAEFKARILAPQAERDILKSKLFLEGTQFSDWLANAKKNASVKIFLPGYSWDGSAVVYGK